MFVLSGWFTLAYLVTTIPIARTIAVHTAAKKHTGFRRLVKAIGLVLIVAVLLSMAYLSGSSMISWLTTTSYRVDYVTCRTPQPWTLSASFFVVNTGAKRVVFEPEDVELVLVPPLSEQERTNIGGRIVEANSGPAPFYLLAPGERIWLKAEPRDPAAAMKLLQDMDLRGYECSVAVTRRQEQWPYDRIVAAEAVKGPIIR